MSKIAVATPEDTPEVQESLDLAVWAVPLWTAAALVVGVVGVYHETFGSMVSKWWASETYAHGFLILPITLYLLWDCRARLRDVSPRPNVRGGAVLAVLGFGWLGCHLAGVLVLEQYFAVGAIPVAVWVVLGGEATRRMAFPLAFLLFGVPVGEALIPPLIDFTAAFTVAGLKLSGVPVLQQGNQLTLPNSTWSVVEACSGLRYLIASVTVGVLFAYLTFESWTRRALCVVAAFIVPVIANGFRAYMIVMLGHLSDMRLAVGIDHLIYGWVFFGIVMFLFLWVMSRFRDESSGSPEPRAPARLMGPAVPARRFVGAGMLVFLVAAIAPVWATQIDAAVFPANAAFAFPETIGEWRLSRNEFGWRPFYVGADLETSADYRRGEDIVSTHVAYYRNQTQGAELVNSSNRLVGPDDEAWRQIRTSANVVALGSGDFPVTEGSLVGRGGRKLVWTWYWIDGTTTTSPYRAKFIEMTSKLLGASPAAAGISLSAPIQSDEDAARIIMAAFLEEMLEGFDKELSSLSETD